MDCIFCAIVEGKIPSTKVYEDADVMAFLDINPMHFGHTLVIPKKHSRNLLDLDAETGLKLFPVMQKIAQAVMTSLQADGVNILQNNEAASGQEVFHTHFHIIPRFASDGYRFGLPHQKYPDVTAMQETASKIAGAIQK